MKFTTAVALAASATVATAKTVGSLNNPFTGNSTGCGACKPFTIEIARGNSDGSKMFSRDAILTNGTIPGPPLKLKVGECVDFTVINHMSDSTGVHFHGIRQLDTPWSDGTPGLSQSAIKGGETYNYRWLADEPGVYFYHSHYKSQMMDGMYGAIIISPDETIAKPYGSLGSIAALEAAEAKIETVIASDWNQFTASRFFQIEDEANIDYACVDSIILNGKGSIYCYDAATIKANQRPQVPTIIGANGTLTAKGCVPASNPLIQGNYTRSLASLPPGAYDQCTPFTGQNYTYTVDAAEQFAAMSFISPAGSALFVVSIDAHKLHVFELNGQYITPQSVDQIKVHPGDRVSFFVKLDQTPADYTIRVANDGVNQVISGFGKLSYRGSVGAAAVPASINIGGTAPPNSTVVLLNNLNSKPFGAPPVSATVQKTFNLGILKNPGSPDAWQWVLNGKAPFSSEQDDQTPMLYQGPANAPQSDLVLRTNYNDWVDLIITVAGPLAQPHPMHKHANKFYVIGSGVGPFNHSTVAEAQAAGKTFNLVNPPYLDGFSNSPALGNSSWMVFRYQANTPGAWFLHCHIQTHFFGGMAVAILDGVDKWPALPAHPGQFCRDNQTTTTTTTTTTQSSTTSSTLTTTTTTGTGSASTTSTSKDADGTTTTGTGSSSTTWTYTTSTSKDTDGTTTTGTGSYSTTWTYTTSTSKDTDASTTSWSRATSKTSGKPDDATTTSKGGIVGGWGDWTTVVDGDATKAPNGNYGPKPTGAHGHDGAFNWAGWQSAIKEAASIEASRGCAKTVLAGSGEQVDGWGVVGGANADIWGSWDAPATTTTRGPWNTKTKTSDPTAAQTWGGWDNAGSNANTDPASATWGGWNNAGSNNNNNADPATSSWAAWNSAGSNAGSDPASTWAAWNAASATASATWSTWTTAAANNVDAASATWSSWAGAPTGVASYNGGNNGVQGVAAYTGAATSVKVGTAVVGAFAMGVVALLL